MRLTFSCGRSWCALCLFGPLGAWVALFVVVVGCSCFFFRPRCLLRSLFSGRGCLGPWRYVVLPPAPPLFAPPFFLPPPCLWCSVVSGLGCLGPWRSAVVSPGSPLRFFFLCLPAPPPFFCVPPVFSWFPFFCSCLFFFSTLVCRFCDAWAGLCVLGCGVCWCVLLCAFCPGGGWCALVLWRLELPGCARSVCVVACPVAVLWCALCFAWLCVVCVCWAWFLLRAAGPCWRCLVLCRGPCFRSFLRCGAALLWCAASRVVCCCLRRVLLVVPCCFVRADWCCVLLPVVAGCSLLGLVARRCFLLVCVVAGAPASPRVLLPCCVLLIVVVARSPVLCPVLRGPVLPCAAVLWRPGVGFPLLVVLCPFLCMCGALLGCASCCSVPFWSALLLVPRAVVCGCALWCLSWGSVVWWSCPGVSWCLAVPCCVLWCCVALWCHGAGLCCVFSFAGGVPFLFKNIFGFLKIKKNAKNKKNYTLPHAHMQAGSKTITGPLSYM